jgi:hypothetical protein
LIFITVPADLGRSSGATVRCADKGLLAELADALDSKSRATPQKPSVKPSDSENQPARLRNACADQPPDPQLAGIVKAWPSLPPDVRKMIVGVVLATLKAGGRQV